MTGAYSARIFEGGGYLAIGRGIFLMVKVVIFLMVKVATCQSEGYLYQPVNVATRQS